ncbi:peptidase M24, partial [Parabacteroides merdae]|nr:peptidase M24 [Parabacteroides merdae]
MRYFWLVIFVLSVGSVSAQNSARVRELEKQRKAALAEIEMTSQLLDETRQTARNSLNRLNLLSKQILSRKQVISLLNQEIGEIDKQIAASRRNISQLEKELGNK